MISRLINNKGQEKELEASVIGLTIYVVGERSVGNGDALLTLSVSEASVSGCASSSLTIS